MQDIGLYRAAAEMIKQHGENAPVQAAMKSDALLAKKGGIAENRLWLRQ